MSWKRMAATLSAAVVIAWAGAARAADQEYGRSGPYLGAGAAYAWENFDVNPEPDDSWGYYARGGYRFNEYFALELDWDHYVGFDSSVGNAKIWNIAVTGKFYPFHGIIQPYVGLGPGYAGIDDNRPNDDDKDGFSMRFAGGIDFYITRNWGVSVETGYFLPIQSSDYGAIPLEFGVLYRFY